MLSDHRSWSLSHPKLIWRCNKSHLWAELASLPHIAGHRILHHFNLAPSPDLLSTLQSSPSSSSPPLSNKSLYYFFLTKVWRQPINCLRWANIKENSFYWDWVKNLFLYAVFCIYVTPAGDNSLRTNIMRRGANRKRSCWKIYFWMPLHLHDTIREQFTESWNTWIAPRPSHW